MNPYDVLGLTSSATTDEVRTAYRRLAMKHHPDRNDGDDAKFKEVQSAYEMVKDGPPERKYDFRGATSKEDIDDVMKANTAFEEMLREARYRYQPQVSVSALISVKDAVLGVDQLMQIPALGKLHTVKIGIPKGIISGETIKYPKLIEGIDVTVKYIIEPNAEWEIIKLNLIKNQNVSIWDLITGGPMDVDLIDGSTIRLQIPPKTQPGTQMRVRGKGILSRLDNVSKGDMLVRLNARIPDTIDPELLEAIRKAS